MYPQPGVSAVIVNCTESACALTLPPEVINGIGYRIIVTNAVRDDVNISATRRASAKFLIHGTFGPKRDEIDAMAAKLASDSENQIFGDWMAEQMALPASSHRAYYRQRLNSRATSGRRACEPGSRWLRYAFNQKDTSSRSNVTITIDSTGVRSLYVNNILRTQVRDFTGAHGFDPNNLLNVTTYQPWNGWICRVGERVGGWHTGGNWGWHHKGGIGLDTNQACTRNAPTLRHFYQPPIDFVTPDPATTLVLAENEATLEFIPWIGRTTDLGRGASMQVGGAYLSGASVSYTDVAVMTAMSGPCTLSTRSQRYRGEGFLRYNGTYFMHDPRVILFDNTLESTSSSTLLGDAGTSSRSYLGSCHNVPKTFLNAHTCRPSAKCSPLTYREANVPLNHSSLRTLHELTNTYIYAVSGLRLESGAPSPCVGTARWRKIRSGECGTDETPLDTNTKATLAQAIRGSTDAANPFVRDAIPNTVAGDCTDTNNGVSATGAKVDVDGECWEHSHPLYYNVYEMGEWASDHPGNAAFSEATNPIKAFARRGETTLAFPASHAMSRFANAVSTTLLSLGKLGDVVSFLNLPSSVKNAESAGAFNALEVSALAESCGSPYEVANLPTAGDHWNMQSGGNGATSSWDTVYFMLSNGYNGFGHIIHLRLALHAADQLRQRAAHALIQVFVMSFTGTDHNWNTEIFINYYDILVRNAFGNLRSILHEISFSGMMASYLTYQNSVSLADANGVLPDENYAREVMQLFSVGLIELAEDGTYQRDALGSPIETYNTEDIGEFAKCWTGFSMRPGRSNLDIEGHSRGNRIDPMVIRGNGRDAKRDLFPKSNLHRGHLGDGHPLCADLPPRHFLSKGAKWTYLGRASGAVSQPESIHEQTAWRLHALYVTQYRFGPRHIWSQSDANMASVPRIRPSMVNSSLYRQLCGNRAVGAACNFTSEVYLPSTLPCDGDECDIDTVAVVDIRDPATNTTVFYECALRPASTHSTPVGSGALPVRLAGTCVRHALSSLSSSR